MTVVEATGIRGQQGHTHAPESLAYRLMKRGTLAYLPPLAAAGVFCILTGICWGVAMLLGGGGIVAPHWFYIPIFMAGLRFGPIGALLAGGIAMVVAGPL